MLQFFQRLENPDSKFHLYDSFYRIKKIEKVCQKEDVDGLLIINGLDSKENYEYTKLMNWMFLGFSGIEIETNEYLDSVLSETVFIITKDHLRVYADQQGFQQLKPYLLQMPNIKMFIPTTKEDENKDESEVLKMAQFVKMMQGLRKIGVLLPKERNQNIEKWPIIQSYGLLGNGFFSMQHDIVNMTDRINQLYKAHDKHSLKTIINVTSQRLNGHVAGSLSLLSEVALKKRPLVTSEQMVEIFLDTFEIEDNKYIKRTNKLMPQVVFGGVSTQDKLPLHFTVESSDLFSSLRFARTYFLTKHIKQENVIQPVFDEFEKFVKEYSYSIIEHPYHIDECLLLDIYKTFVESLHQSLQMICQDYRKMTRNDIFDLCYEKLQPIYSKYQINQKNDDLQISVTSYNAFGDEVPINFKDAISFKLTPQFFNIRLEQRNINSLAIPSNTLGSVIFSESFILQENCFYIITSNIPYLQMINTDTRFSEDIEKIKKKLPLPKLGQQISEKVDKNRIFIPSKHSILEIPIFSGSYYLHENGLRIYSNELGWLVILFEQMKKIRVIQGLDSVWMIFITQFPLAFASLDSKIISLEFVGKAVDQVFMKITNIFKETGIKFEYIENPKEFFLTRQGRIIMKKEQKVPLMGNQIHDPNFLLDYLESKQLIILTQVKSDLKLLNYLSLQNEQIQQNESRIGLILITGAYSSGKTKFAQSLLRYATDFSQKAQILCFNLLEQSILDEDGWLNKLENQLKYCKDQCLCIVPFFLSIDQIVQQLCKGKLSQKVYIKNVVNKININNMFLNENFQPIENLISQCLPGYCQFTILDSFGNEEQEVEEYHKIFRTICTKSNIFRITNNMIQSSVAKEIYLNDSYNSAQNTFLRSKLAAFKGQSTPYQIFFIHNQIPCLKLLRRTLKEFFKNQQLEKSSKQAYEKLSEIDRFIYKVKEFTATGRPQLLYFKTFLRFEGQLDKLFEYTANPNYIIERQSKNINIIMKEQIVNGLKLQVPQYPGWDHQSNLGFLLVGYNLNKDYCQDLIGSLVQKMKDLQPLLTKNDLSKEVIKELEFKNRIIGLENGEFYDGQFIRNQDGEILEHHPKLQQFIEEYLEVENQKIAIKNNQIQEEWINYIKSIQC